MCEWLTENYRILISCEMGINTDYIANGLRSIKE